ncbi:hypothetical protein ACNKU7_01700 [Microbulbifer sp. SA54]|uniref:hypothetical protein n=1 Tax=Microbulbifer sp. SA54 TaxID=3401577 RepID=UPI003AAAE32E
MILVNVPEESVALENNGIQLQFTTRTVSEALPIKEFADEWRQPPGKGDSTWTRNRFFQGVWYEGWGFGYTQRFDYQLGYNEATTDLYYRDENDLDAPAGRVPVLLKISQLRAQGVKLQRRWQWSSGFFAQADLSLLSASDFQDGILAGELGSNGDFFSGSARLDYRYSEDLLLEHQFEPPKGRGLALDLNLGYTGTHRSARLILQDLYSAIEWRQAPHTQGAFDTVDRDVANAVQLSPLFSGKRLLTDYRQRMPLFAEAQYTEYRPSSDWMLDLEYFDGDLRYRPGIRWGRLPGNPYLGYEMIDGQWLVQFSDDRGMWSFQLGSDSTSWEKANSLTLAFGFSLPVF